MAEMQPTPLSFWKSLEQRKERLTLLLLIYAIGINAAALVFEVFVGSDFLLLPMAFEPLLLSAGLVVITATTYVWVAGRLNARSGKAQRYWFARSQKNPTARPSPVTWEGWAIAALLVAVCASGLVLIVMSENADAAFPQVGALFYVAALIAIPAYFLKTQPRSLSAEAQP
ncbi:MAG: hypothetical protein RIA71_00875 [Oceanicaulis sp.]